MSTLIEKHKADIEATIRACALADKSLTEVSAMIGLSKAQITKLARGFGLKLRGMQSSRVKIDISQKQREMLVVELGGVAARYGLSTKQLCGVLMKHLYPSKPKPTAPLAEALPVHRDHALAGNGATA